jgi:hypothetical protein
MDMSLRSMTVSGFREYLSLMGLAFRYNEVSREAVSLVQEVQGVVQRFTL